MHWKKIDSGRFITGDFRNFDTGMILPRATPPWSGTRHSISSIDRAAKKSLAWSRPSTPRAEEISGFSAFFFLLIAAHTRFPLRASGGRPETCAGNLFDAAGTASPSRRPVPGSGPDQRAETDAPRTRRGHAKEASAEPTLVPECPRGRADVKWQVHGVWPFSGVPAQPSRSAVLPPE